MGKSTFKDICRRGAKRLSILPWSIRNKRAFRQGKGPRRILLFSDPRGGSTWLASILQRIPNSYLFFEPLNQRLHPENEKYGFYRYQYIPDGEEWKEAECFFSHLLAPAFLSYSFVQEPGVTRADTYIYKFCYGKLLLPWLVDRFDVHPILLVRHPCAVVASQLSHDAWKKWSPTSFSYPQGAYAEYFREHRELLDRLEHKEEFLTAFWALGMKRTVQHPYNDRHWTTLAYEHLYLDPAAFLRRIGERTRMEVNEDMLRAVEEPSWTTMKRKEELRDSAQLLKWRSKLDQEQIDRILKVVQDLGVEGYSEAALPDPSKLYKDEKTLENAKAQNEHFNELKDGGA